MRLFKGTSYHQVSVNIIGLVISLSLYPYMIIDICYFISIQMYCWKYGLEEENCSSRCECIQIYIYIYIYIYLSTFKILQL